MQSAHGDVMHGLEKSIVPLKRGILVLFATVPGACVTWECSELVANISVTKAKRETRLGKMNAEC